jgi:hypothetical protein
MSKTNLIGIAYIQKKRLYEKLKKMFIVFYSITRQIGEDKQSLHLDIFSK